MQNQFLKLLALSVPPEAQLVVSEHRVVGVTLEVDADGNIRSAPGQVVRMHTHVHDIGRLGPRLERPASSSWHNRPMRLPRRVALAGLVLAAGLGAEVTAA